MLWTRITAVTDPLDQSPALRPLTLAEAKAHMRVEDSDEDSVIERLIDAAVAGIEGPKGLGIAVMKRQWKLTLDCFPRTIEIPINQVSTIDKIEYVDNAGDIQTLAASKYRVDLDTEPARIERAYNAEWPTALDVIGAVTVTFTAGYEGSEDVPADLKAGLLLTIGHLYEHRESVVAGVSMQEVPQGAMAIFERYRVGRFGA
jgi:uncharacterized phiE125 gp8 family phage protein